MEPISCAADTFDSFFKQSYSISSQTQCDLKHDMDVNYFDITTYYIHILCDVNAIEGLAFLIDLIFIYYFFLNMYVLCVYRIIGDIVFGFVGSNFDRT